MAMIFFQGLNIAPGDFQVNFGVEHCTSNDYYCNQVDFAIFPGQNDDFLLKMVPKGTLYLQLANGKIKCSERVVPIPSKRS